MDVRTTTTPTTTTRITTKIKYAQTKNKSGTCSYVRNAERCVAGVLCKSKVLGSAKLTSNSFLYTCLFFPPQPPQ